MQPTKTQVEHSLAALQTEAAAPAGESVLSTSAGDDHVVRVAHDLRQELPVGLLERLEFSPAVRTERLEEARAHIEHNHVSADELADRIVGRLVCDRLR